jgi:hypothetical protein
MRKRLDQVLGAVALTLLWLGIVYGGLAIVVLAVLIAAVAGVLLAVWSAWRGWRRWRAFVDRQIDDGPLRDDPPMFI